jgi:serpin B
MYASPLRVCVFTILVTIASTLSNIMSEPSNLSAAETEQSPTQVVATADGEFALNLYRQLAKQTPDKNLFFSPYSMTSALAMAIEGARGSTADEMGKTLCFPAAARRTGDDAQQRPWNTAIIHAGMAELNRQLCGQEKTDSAIREKIAELRKQLEEARKQLREGGRTAYHNNAMKATERGRRIANELNSLLAQVDQYELRVANGLWGEKGHPFRREFLDVLQTNYATGAIALMDFSNAPEVARKEINDWCEKQTNGRISNAMPQGSITPQTRLVLANAIYFLGQWLEPFDAKSTKDEDFTLGTKETVRVPMMHKWHVKNGYAAFNADGSLFETPDQYNPRDEDESKLYPDDQGFLAADFAYKGGGISMTVIVPRSPDGLGNLESLLTPERLKEWLGHLKQRKVNVWLPKFKLQTSYEMSKALEALGMVQAFDLKKADFSGISTADEPLSISAVIHKAFVEVNEKGTEAAAFTGIAMATAAPPPRLKPFIPDFKADRPFVFLIRDQKSGAILFMGRVTNPQS